MPTLIVEDMPAKVIESLTERAVRERRSVRDELLSDLDLADSVRAQTIPPRRLPDYIPGDEINIVCGVIRTGEGVEVEAIPSTEPRRSAGIVIEVPQ
jgi:hypothetical protein